MNKQYNQILQIKQQKKIKTKLTKEQTIEIQI